MVKEMKIVESAAECLRTVVKQDRVRVQRLTVHHGVENSVLQIGSPTILNRIRNY